jgi:hypothetical protein
MWTLLVCIDVANSDDNRPQSVSMFQIEYWFHFVSVPGMHETSGFRHRSLYQDPNRMIKSTHTTQTESEDDEKTPTEEDVKTNTHVITEYSRHTWQCSMLLKGKSLSSVYSYSDWLVFRRKVHIRFGESRVDLWFKYYGPMDRIWLDQECTDVFEEVFEEFPLAHILFHKLDRGKSGSITKLW